MKNLEQMDYNELVELKKLVERNMARAKGRLSKCDTREIMDSYFADRLFDRLRGEGLGVDENRGDHIYNSVVQEKKELVVNAVGTICDITLGNYIVRESKNNRKYKPRGLTLYCNGSLISSVNNEAYKKMVEDISKIIASNMDVYDQMDIDPEDQ